MSDIIMSDNKLKILYVITQGEWGGAQRYVYDLATKLGSDFEIYIAVGEPNGKRELQNKVQSSKFSTKGGSALGGKVQNNTQYPISNIQIIDLKHQVRNISPIHDILAVFELAKLYRKIKPDIVHLNSSKAGVIGSLSILMTYDLGLKNIYTAHGWVFNEPTRWLGHWLYRFLERLTVRWKNKIIVLSDRDLADGIKLGIEENKLIKIPLGIEMPQFLSKEEARKKLGQYRNIQHPISNILIGTIANLYPSKGLDVLIETTNIIKNIRKILENIKLVIIGEGPERPKLEKLIEKYNLRDKIFLTGQIDNASQYLKAFDLFALPSRKEGMPYTVLETMMSKVPVIAANVGGISELIEDKKTGLLAQSGDPKELANSILYAIENAHEMQKMAENAFLKSHEFSLEQMVKKTNSLYSVM